MVATNEIVDEPQSNEDDDENDEETEHEDGQERPSTPVPALTVNLLR